MAKRETVWFRFYDDGQLATDVDDSVDLTVSEYLLNIIEAEAGEIVVGNVEAIEVEDINYAPVEGGFAWSYEITAHYTPMEA